MSYANKCVYIPDLHRDERQLVNVHCCIVQLGDNPPKNNELHHPEKETQVKSLQINFINESKL